MVNLVRYRRVERHKALREVLLEDPFIKDEDLAERFGVSVSTIRLDRAELGIPELRERTRAVARESYAALKALGQQELIGELKELKVGERALSEMLIEESMVLTKARVARGHYLFAQANSLAIALVDAQIAVTGSVNIRFMRPVGLGEVVVAQGYVKKRKGNKYWIEVMGTVGEEVVLRGEWIVFAVEGPLLMAEKELDGGEDCC